MKKRLLYYELIKHLNHKNALLITGMRQVGKTTLMRQIYEEVKEPKLWFDFGNPLDQKIFEDEDYRVIYKRLTDMGKKASNLSVFIDEIQNFPEITKVIKYLIDHYSVKFYLTGSSNYYLKTLFPESLSGRKFLYELPPLSFQEYLYFRDVVSLKEILNLTLQDAPSKNSIFTHKARVAEYDDFLTYGGFPEVVTTEDKNMKVMVLKNIFASFFEKNIKILSDYTDIRELRDMILLLVPRVGSMLDVTRLSSELSIDRVKIYRFLEFLQGTFFIRLLPRFSNSIDRAVAGGKKVFFTDTGLLNVIGKVSEAQVFENAVINQLSGYNKISFYNKRNTAEIDAILDKHIAFEIKLTGTVRDFSKLSTLSLELGISQNYVVSKRFLEKPGFLSPVVL
ncbi:ATP-binding protein [Candidatus Parcubacteria bacterium]|nr:ATP-binding protein [Patescibacteria group bacterium]MCG2689586.1 ATP-binding protein [Candidatus Parcubacteria bacterium]